jgi:meiotic recombination protein REC8
MLTDAEKVQHHMQTFFQVWGTSTVDPQAGKAKYVALPLVVGDEFMELANSRAGATSWSSWTTQPLS